MQNIDNIIYKGRFKISFWDLFFVGLLLFGLITLLFLSILYCNSNYTQNILIIFSLITTTLISFFFCKVLFKKITFNYFMNYSTKSNHNIILEIASELSLNLYKHTPNVFYLFHYTTSKLWSFTTKKTVCFIVNDSTIMLNIRNADVTIALNFFSDSKQSAIKNSLKFKTDKIDITNKINYWLN